MVGDYVENFVLEDEDGNKFNLYDNLEKNKVLLVFYPKDKSLVCTLQLKGYNKNEEAFRNNGIKIIGINAEDNASHKSFCNSAKLDFPLLADEDKVVSKRFDALNLIGINKRKLVLINQDKKIVFEKATFSIYYLNSNQIFKMLKNIKVL